MSIINTDLLKYGIKDSKILSKNTLKPLVLESLEIIRGKILKEPPGVVYHFAKDIDREPRDDTRKASCEDSYYAYLYAINLDKIPRADTYKAVLGSSWLEPYIFRLGIPKEYLELAERVRKFRSSSFRKIKLIC